MSNERKRSVAIEDLLRLKRVERPEAGFWTRFDYELRAKQLTALVGRRPWWHRLPRALGKFARYSAPAGAMAALLLVGFVQFRDEAPSSLAMSLASSTPVVRAPDAPAMAPVSVEEKFAEVLYAQEEVLLVAEAEIDVPVTEDAVASVVEPMPSSGLSPVTSLLDSAPHLRPVPEDVMLGVRHLGLPLAWRTEVESMIGVGLSGEARGFESRAIAARVAVEPLQHMTSPQDVRKRQRMAALVSMSVEPATASSSKFVQSLPEDRVYDQIQRFSGKGDRLSFSF